MQQISQRISQNKNQGPQLTQLTSSLSLYKRQCSKRASQIYIARIIKGRGHLHRASRALSSRHSPRRSSRRRVSALSLATVADEYKSNSRQSLARAPLLLSGEGIKISRASTKICHSSFFTRACSVALSRARSVINTAVKRRSAQRRQLSSIVISYSKHSSHQIQ